ncbi:MAG: energy-coupled thiamine transporter ThiT [Oscillospiraceae bacterium]
MATKTSKEIHILVESAILLAIATVLSFFPKFEGIWVNGGSITLCSMLPIIFISYRNGLKWGLLSGFAFSLLQLLTGGFYPAGTSILMVFATLLFDYMLPYTCIGLGGMFKGKTKNVTMDLVSGVVVALGLRYVCHLVSGFVLWNDVTYATEMLQTPGFAFGLGATVAENFTGNGLFAIYNVLYNGSYMIPEIIITCIGAVLLARFANFSIEKK